MSESKKVHVTYQEVGKELLKAWGWDIIIDCEVPEDSWPSRHYRALKKAAKESSDEGRILCLLMYLASREQADKDKFMRVRDYLLWVEDQYQQAIQSREARHGKCPTGVKLSIRNSLWIYTTLRSHWCGLVEAGELRVIDGRLYCYGAASPVPTSEMIIKDCINRMSKKVKAQYDIWMKKRPTPATPEPQPEASSHRPH